MQLQHNRKVDHSFHSSHERMKHGWGPRLRSSVRAWFPWLFPDSVIAISDRFQHKQYCWPIIHLSSALYYWDLELILTRKHFMVSRETDLVLGYSRHKGLGGKQTSTKQDIVTKDKFSVHLTEITGPWYRSAKLGLKSYMKMWEMLGDSNSRVTWINIRSCLTSVYCKDLFCISFCI